MDTKFKKDDKVYLIDNAHFIEEAVVMMNIAGFVTIGGTRVRECRLYPTRKEAEAVVKGS